MVLGQFLKKLQSLLKMLSITLRPRAALFKPCHKWSETMVLGQFLKKLHISVENVIDNIATASCTFQTLS